MIQQPKRLSHNTLILLLNNGGTAILAFGLTIIITRGMGHTVFGQYAAIMAWILPLTVLVDFGIGTLIMRDVAQNRGTAISYLKMTHPLRWIIGGSVIGGVWLAAPLLSEDARVVMGLRIGIFLALIDAHFASYTAVFRAWEIMWPILALNIGLLTMQMVGAGIVVWQAGNVTHLVMVLVIADGVQLAATWGVWRYLQRKHDAILFSITSLSRVFRLAKPFAIAGVLAILQARVIVILVDRFLETEQVGWYAAATRLIEAVRLVPNALFTALFPQLVALAGSQQAFNRVFRWATILLGGYAVMMGVVSWIGADAAIQLLFGEEFEGSAKVLRLLAWSLVPGLLRALWTIKLYAYQRERVVNGFIGVALAAQVGFGMILVPHYGLTGAAWTVILSETLLLLSLWGATKSIWENM